MSVHSSYKGARKPTSNRKHCNYKKLTKMTESRTVLQALCSINVMLLIACCGMMYFTPYWIIGCVILTVGSVIDLLLAFGYQSYTLCWHVFMATIVGCSSAFVEVSIFYSEICSKAVPKGDLPESNTCILTAVTAGCGFLITIIEIVIILVGVKAKIPMFCCFNSNSEVDELNCESKVPDSEKYVCTITVSGDSLV